MLDRIKQVMQQFKTVLHSLWKNVKTLWPLLPRLKQFLQKKETVTERDPSVESLQRGVVYKGSLAAVAFLLAVVMLFAMTAAWYKNVVQTSGLLFNVDQWGLDSSVSLQEKLINAAPGDSGMIDLSVDNTSDGVIDVTLGVSKGDLYNDIADMRKRLYFYIDDMVYRGGEYTPRVYLNSVENYSYTVLFSQNLVLGTNGNAAPLVWEWVFDVLGYYFYGSVIEGGTAQVSEYLRPVEYTLDDATFSDGVLTTVDGTTPPAAFIEEITACDGFAGTVTVSVTDKQGRVYYPVLVDETTGQGVWIYLCSLGEIEYETMVDTNLGNAETTEMRRFTTYLHVTAQQKQLTVAEVATEEQLNVALNNNAYDMVQLTGNVALTEQLTVSGTSEKILDMGGYTLSTSASTVALVEEGASLTVLDGTLQGAGTSSAYGVEVQGGDVALSNVIITDTAQGLRIVDGNAGYNDSRVNLMGCTIYSTVAGINIRGNGVRTVADTCLTIDECLIESSGYYAITGSGNPDTYGTNIHILNSALRATGATGSAIYHPQRDSTLLVENSVLEGFTAVAIKGGTVTLTDTTVLAKAREGITPQTPAFSGSGYADTGAAVYVETGYNYPCKVTIGGNSVITSENADALLFFESTNALYDVSVTGGSYSSNVTDFLPEDDSYTCVLVSEGETWVVRPKE